MCIKIVFTIILIILIILIFWNYSKKNIESFSICGRFNLNRKEIWVNTKNKYGEKKALNIFPHTYILPQDLNALLKDKNEQFILKTLWGGARKGVQLYNNKNDIIKDYQKYDIAQVYISNPLLVNGFKFDIRYFIVAYCGVGVFLYKKAYNVYTENKFDYNSLDRSKKINQVYTLDNHYTKNNLPRSTQELGSSMGINFNRINLILASKLKKIFNSCKDMCCKNDIGNYHVFGLDVELLSNLDPIIIEINSSPSLNFDEEWKNNLTNDLKKDIQNKNFKNNWIKI